MTKNVVKAPAKKIKITRATATEIRKSLKIGIRATRAVGVALRNLASVRKPVKHSTAKAAKSTRPTSRHARAKAH